MLRKLSAILMTLCLTVGTMTPLAHAAGGLRLVTSSQEAASQEVGFSGVSSNCQSFQATFNLSNSTAIYDFMANDVLDALPGIYTTYKQEGSAVTVKAVFAAQETDPDFPFTDVAKGSWYYEGVRYAYENGLMSGTGEGTFSPDLPTSRGMLVTILYRLAGSPAAGSASFTDVAKGRWYADGVAWASANGVVSGYPDGSFRPNDTITRGQMAAILYQYARIQGKLDDSRADLSIFSDLDSLSAYAKEPMSWAVAQGLFSGVSADTLAPGGSTTRAQAAVILTAFSKAQG